MRAFRIAWYSILEDESVLEGRSLIKASTQEEAISQLITTKSQEYRIKPYLVNVHSIVELSSGDGEDSSS